jgi:hypothetical protein
MNLKKFWEVESKWMKEDVYNLIVIFKHKVK